MDNQTLEDVNPALTSEQKVRQRINEENEAKKLIKKFNIGKDITTNPDGYQHFIGGNVGDRLIFDMKRLMALHDYFAYKYVSVSGGKDSTVMVESCIMVIRENEEKFKEYNDAVDKSETPNEDVINYLVKWDNQFKNDGKKIKVNPNTGRFYGSFLDNASKGIKLDSSHNEIEYKKLRRWKDTDWKNATFTTTDWYYEGNELPIDPRVLDEIPQETKERFNNGSFTEEDAKKWFIYPSAGRLGIYYFDNELNPSETYDVSERIFRMNADILNVMWYALPVMYGNGLAVKAGASNWESWMPADEGENPKEIEDIWGREVPNWAVNFNHGDNEETMYGLYERGIRDDAFNRTISPYLYEKFQGPNLSIVGVTANESLTRRILCVSSEANLPGAEGVAYPQRTETNPNWVVYPMYAFKVPDVWLMNQKIHYRIPKKGLNQDTVDFIQQVVDKNK